MARKWDNPTSVDIDGVVHPIRNKCDYRVVLDIIAVLNDNELEMEDRLFCSLFIFYGNDKNNTIAKVLYSLKNAQKAAEEMMRIINLGEEQTEEKETKPPIMDWSHDFMQIAPPISRVLGYSVREENKYTHYYDFVGAYMEIGECSFSTIINIRQKKQKGKKLENWEQEYYLANKKIIDLPRKLTAEEEEFLNSDW